MKLVSKASVQSFGVFVGPVKYLSVYFKTGKKRVFNLFACGHYA